MKKVLFLCTADPLGVGGGEYAIRSYLRAICDLAGGNVDLLITKGWKGDYKKTFSLENVYTVPERSSWQIMSQYISLFIDRFSKKAIELVQDNPNRYSCVVANGSILAGSISKKLRNKGIPVITIYHNFESDYYKDNFKGAKKLLFLPVVKLLERRAYNNSSRNLFLSGQDMQQFTLAYGDGNGRNSVLGVYEYNDRPLQASSVNTNDSITFVITGSLNIEQGVDGIRYFFNSLYRSLPLNAHVIIAGKRPTDLVVNLCAKHVNVDLVPNPQDINDIIKKGDVYICPTRLGGGVKLRVMDGLRSGLPVITHACSARGYDIFFDHPSFEVFDTPESFASSVTRITEALKKNVINRKSIYDEYKKVFSYEAGKRRMYDYIKDFLQ